MTVKIYCWRQNDGGADFHATYLLTDKGGIGVDAGFSAEGGPQPPDPRRKALLGLVFVLLLIAGGLLLTYVLRRVSQLQDCAMSGRSNCASIDSTPTATR